MKKEKQYRNQSNQLSAYIKFRKELEDNDDDNDDEKKIQISYWLGRGWQMKPKNAGRQKNKKKSVNMIEIRLSRAHN